MQLKHYSSEETLLRKRLNIKFGRDHYSFYTFASNTKGLTIKLSYISSKTNEKKNNNMNKGLLNQRQICEKKFK